MAEELAPYYFHQGTDTHSYEYLGAHPSDGGEGWVFRVWAPNAYSVHIVGDFCGWSVGIPMKRITDGGVWEGYAERALAGCRYKYKITSLSGVGLKADPYAFYSETLKKTASILWQNSTYPWTDGEYLARRLKRASSKTFFPYPMNIYEVHPGSWRTRDGKSTKDGTNYLTYREIADSLSEYCLQMGYTHVELMPVAEHPYDGSWGYQVCGYYAPTSRFGDPDGLKYLVDKMHSLGIGVIFDWVPAHFPKDAHGLYEFDGSLLYEYQGKDRMEHKGWGTRFFDVGRNEVQSFLVSNALYWLREFHADGLRVDAVASMLYLDYDRPPEEWIRNVHGDNKNLEAIAFFKKLNGAVFGEFPDALMIAEESADWAMLTKPLREGGLGFSFKWNMGFANDAFSYVALDPVFRRYEHKKLNFSLMYAFNESYILPVSHDEVVHGKKSLLNKMWGDYGQKFAGFRLFMLWLMGHPGKKMTFMGCEYGPFREWDYENQLEWFMLDYPKHADLHGYVRALNLFYLQRRELWENDFSYSGFEWIYPDAADENMLAFRRLDLQGRELIFVLNFSAVKRLNIPIPVKEKAYAVVFDSEDRGLGGEGNLTEKTLYPENGLIFISLKPLSGICLDPIGAKELSEEKYV